MRMSDALSTRPSAPLLTPEQHAALGLRIEPREIEALRRVLVALEAGEAESVSDHAVRTYLLTSDLKESPPVGFCMRFFACLTECGTAACLGGWAIALSPECPRLFDDVVIYSHPGHRRQTLEDLFATSAAGYGDYLRSLIYERATPEMAARVLRAFLETGRVTWAREMEAHA